MHPQRNYAQNTTPLDDPSVSSAMKEHVQKHAKSENFQVNQLVLKKDSLVKNTKEVNLMNSTLDPTLSQKSSLMEHTNYQMNQQKFKLQQHT